MGTRTRQGRQPWSPSGVLSSWLLSPSQPLVTARGPLEGEQDGGRGDPDQTEKARRHGEMSFVMGHTSQE